MRSIRALARKADVSEQAAASNLQGTAWPDLLTVIRLMRAVGLRLSVVEPASTGSTDAHTARRS